MSPGLQPPDTRRYWIAVLVPAVFGVLACLLAVFIGEQYGVTLFCATPLLMGFATGMTIGYGKSTGFGRAYGAALLSFVVAGLLLVLFAIEGIICLIMALPLAALFALPTTALGLACARAFNRRLSTGVTLVLLLVAYPGMVAFEASLNQSPPQRIVTTSIEIDAPPDTVWNSVVAFSEITAPPEFIFRLGVGCPLRAEIKGSGVGAVRHCVFTTGAFVEPITVWDPPRKLAFDVTQSPPPLKEFTPYEHIHPPHLDFMQSERGQFILEPSPDGKTKLIGTTWYSHDIAPTWYWSFLSDHIIHRIHHRVLDHIKTVAESTPPPAKL